MTDTFSFHPYATAFNYHQWRNAQTEAAIRESGIDFHPIDPSAGDAATRCERWWANPQLLGHDGDGIPVYDNVAFPFHDIHIEGEYYAPLQRSDTFQLEKIPAAGPKRDAFIKEWQEELRQSIAREDRKLRMENFLADLHARVLENRSEAELHELQMRDKMQDVMQESHERELAHMEHMTLEQYRTANDFMRSDHDFTRDGQYSDRFTGGNGDAWKIDVHGNAYRLSD